MQNSNSPPRYGAEGPPGGVEAWNRQRFGQEQGKNIPKMFRQLGERIGAGPLGQAAQANRMARAQPQPWSQVARTQWPGQGGAPQGMPPQAQGTPPMQPQGTPTMQAQPTQAQARPPQQYGMAGLGQAAGKGVQMMQAAALRRRGGMQEQ